MLWLLRLLCPRPLGVTDIVNGIYGMKDSPDLPDYTGGAKATSDSSIQAAIVNAYLNHPTQTTPYGTQTWEQTGSVNVPGVGGQAGFAIPQMSSSIKFSPQGQQMFDMQEAIKTGLMKQAGGTLNQVQGALQNPMDFSKMPQLMSEADLRANGDKVTNALYDRSMNILQPQFDTENRRTESELVNKGFSVGDEGYTRAKADVSRNQGVTQANARDTAIAAGGAEQTRLQNLAMMQRQQAIQEAVASRTMPLSELSSLMTGGSPAAPSFQNFTGANSTGANFLGADQAQGQAELSRYGLETERSNAIHKGIMDIWKQAAGGVGSFGGGS